MPKWLLPTLSEILALNDPAWMVQFELPSGRAAGAEPIGQPRSSRLAIQRVRAEREWSGAIAALNILLQNVVVTAEASDREPTSHGFVLSGPLPVISHPALVCNFSTWSLTANPLNVAAWLPLQLLPANETTTAIDVDETPSDTRPSEKPTTSALPLLPGDPLAAEQFCLVLTPQFSLVLVLGESLQGTPAFMFSFMPEVVEQAWNAIRPRILLMNADQIDQLDDLAKQFTPVAPDYTTVMQFSRLMLAHLPEPLEEWRSDKADSQPVAFRQEAVKHGQASFKRKDVIAHSLLDPSPYHAPFSSSDDPSSPDADDPTSPDIELLQALAHEIRTPLTTIRTLTRSLLKRTDLPPDALKRLSIIDRECSEQIDRFGLIFRAVELQTSPARHDKMSLTRTPLAQMFQQSIPRWQQQASQRQLTLAVVLPPKMPTVVSDPTMLDQALTSLIERFTRSLPGGSHIQVEVMLAGDQLKVQLQSEPDAAVASRHHHRPLLRSLGQLLMFQPETGSLSLNLAVTKSLFQALGGKLIVRDRPQQGEVMTVFLPLEMSSMDIMEI
ncbi:sensor histidine kinase [Stenomitos frigidus]|uniref:histidine kinase n=1 Tax=Stenomitos frigidus ULC18 TaxID=2107698 RepID=A0A2T1EA36_9CYAN|nr:HAMP domain-containing sensor histidine kinase [Stenomitos frigidus]PSB29574.1 sensor histidine kinase [Stenomitos frigidus ULC18]